MKERMRFVTDWERGLYSMVELCERYGVSRKTGYKWLTRYEGDGVDGLRDRSRAPHQCPHRIAADARGIGLSASRWHPRRMTSRARRFRLDALAAKRELGAQRPSTLRGQRARRLAVAAFGDFAVVGSQWALSGVARLHHRNALAERHARIATRYAAAGKHLFTTASRLLRA